MLLYGKYSGILNAWGWMHAIYIFRLHHTCHVIEVYSPNIDYSAVSRINHLSLCVPTTQSGLEQHYPLIHDGQDSLRRSESGIL